MHAYWSTCPKLFPNGFMQPQMLRVSCPDLDSVFLSRLQHWLGPVSPRSVGSQRQRQKRNKILST